MENIYNGCQTNAVAEALCDHRHHSLYTIDVDFSRELKAVHGHTKDHVIVHRLCNKVYKEWCL